MLKFMVIFGFVRSFFHLLLWVLNVMLQLMEDLFVEERTDMVLSMVNTTHSFIFLLLG